MFKSVLLCRSPSSLPYYVNPGVFMQVITILDTWLRNHLDVQSFLRANLEPHLAGLWLLPFPCHLAVKGGLDTIMGITKTNSIMKPRNAKTKREIEICNRWNITSGAKASEYKFMLETTWDRYWKNYHTGKFLVVSIAVAPLGPKANRWAAGETGTRESHWSEPLCRSPGLVIWA